MSALGEAQRQAQRAQWLARLERAREALTAYQQAARYPHESRPVDEHPDQVRPFEPIVEERPLRVPGGTPSQGMKLRTSQQRVFVSGNDVSLVTLTLQDDQGRVLPLRVNRAVLRELTPPGSTARTPQLAMDVNDAGRAGDVAAGDGVFSLLVQPAAQGFDTFAGVVRLELALEYGGQPGFIYFDHVYSPEQAARWLPGVRDEVVAGALEFGLEAEVLIPGRYVVSARVDDASGQPFAITTFNQEIGRGVQAIKLPVFGKLIRDRAPPMPLRLRDVEAFLLKPDAHPDRVMLPRLAGVVHSSKTYVLAAFSTAPWSSDERDRYLAELNKDVNAAQGELERLGP